MQYPAQGYVCSEAEAAEARIVQKFGVPRIQLFSFVHNETIHPDIKVCLMMATVLDNLQQLCARVQPSEDMDIAAQRDV